MITYEEAIKVLKELKESAKYVRENDEYILTDFRRHCVEDEKRYIVATLANLNLE